MSATVVLADTSLAVVPGETLSVAATVTNTGHVVDAIALDVVGLAPGWGRVEPPEVRLLPGRKREVVLVLAPPRLSSTARRVHVLGLRARCAEDPAGGCVEEADLEVLPFVDVTAELVPRSRSVRGRRTASYTVAVDNRGNAAVRVGLDAYDPDQDLALAVGRSQLDCAPGSATFATVLARGESTYWRGPELSKGFLAVVTVPGTDGPIELPGALGHRAVLPPSLPRLVSRAALLVGSLLALLLVLPALVGEDEGFDAATRAAVDDAVGPANDTALEAAADAEAARRAAEGAAAEVAAASPSVPPPTRPTQALDTRPRPFTARLQVGAATTGPFLRVPLGRQVTLEGFVLQPNGDRGEMTLLRNGSPLVSARLGDTQVFDLPAPVLFGPASSLQLAVVCRNPVGDPCDTALLLTGTVRALPVSTPTPAPGRVVPGPVAVPEPALTADPLEPLPEPAPDETTAPPAPDPDPTTDPLPEVPTPTEEPLPPITGGLLPGI